MSSLESLAHKWKNLGTMLLIPTLTLNNIQSEYSNDAERLRAAVRYWLLQDPLASWKRLIYELDLWDDEDAHKVADTIRIYAEKLPGQHAATLIMLKVW